MPKPRYRLVDTASTPYYHCVSRCVRRAFLCGDDHYTGKNFDHRKQWLIDRIRHLSSIFAIDVAAYAIMSNHFHLVVHIDVKRANAWSRDDVLDKWLSLFSGPDLVHRYRKGEMLEVAELGAINELVAIWQKRLSDLSWFMRCLNETIARLANVEDDCTGRFWEGRFRSQALLDDAALVACMAYVDLNPIRAGLCDSLMNSDFTSIQARLQQLASSEKSGETEKASENGHWLLPFADEQKKQVPLPITCHSYLALIDWTGRIVREDKQGAIPKHVPPLLDALGIEQKSWTKQVQTIGKQGVRARGTNAALSVFALKHRHKWLSGQSVADQHYSG